MLLEGLQYHRTHVGKEMIVIRSSHVFHVEIDDRKCVLVGLILFMLRNRQAIEPCIALVLHIEECVQHREVRRLPESPGARVQVYSPIVRVEDILDEQGLIDIILVILAKISEGQACRIHLFHNDVSLMQYNIFWTPPNFMCS